MSWVKEALQQLQQHGKAKVRPLGGSMRGRIESGQLVTIVPANLANLKVDDVVFIKWRGNYLLHLIKGITLDRVLIGNNIGKINGWTSINDVVGVVTAVED